MPAYTADDVRLVVVDTETTGTKKESDRICQVASIELHGLGSPDMSFDTLFTTYCDPVIPMTEAAFNVHGIGPESYQGEPSDKHTLAVLGSLLRRMGGPDEVILVGHNSCGFDLPLMDFLCPEAEFLEYHSVDTMKLAYHFLGTDRRRRARLASDEDQMKAGELGLVQWYLEEEAENAHDAEADCVMCAAVLNKFMTDERNPFGQDLLEMAEFCGKPRIFNRMPFGKYAGCLVDRNFSKGSVPKHYFNFFLQQVPDMSPDLEATVRWALRVDRE